MFNKFNKRNPLLMLLAVLAVAVLLAGCLTPSLGGGTYSGSETRRAQTVHYGTITALNDSVIDDKATGLGVLGGGVVGGIAGSTIGGGKGRTLTTLGGAALGALAGHGVERAVNKKKGLEVTVRMEEGGKMISIVQQLDQEAQTLAVGQRVRVLMASDGSARVRP